MFETMMEIVSVFNGEISEGEAMELAGVSGKVASQAFHKALKEFKGVTVKVAPSVSYTDPVKALRRFNNRFGKPVNPIDTILAEEGISL